ncbi:MAG: hypothetical protein ACLUN5_02245 [Oscillospiraceae bacterium]
MKTKKIGLVGIYFPGAYDALHENVPEGFELVDALSPEAYGNLADCEYLISDWISIRISSTTPRTSNSGGAGAWGLTMWISRHGANAASRLRPVRASIPALWRSWPSC